MAFEGFKSWTEKLKEKSKEDTIEFKNFDEIDNETGAAKSEEAAEETARSVVGAADNADGNLELKVVRPESLAEVSTIADYLLDKCTVVLNLELLDEHETTRMLDFLNGVRYSTDGDLQSVSQSTYIITPHNVDISDK